MVNYETTLLCKRLAHVFNISTWTCGNKQNMVGKEVYFILLPPQTLSLEMGRNGFEMFIASLQLHIATYLHVYLQAWSCG